MVIVSLGLLFPILSAQRDPVYSTVIISISATFSSCLAGDVFTVSSLTVLIKHYHIRHVNLLKRALCLSIILSAVIMHTMLHN